MSVDKLRALEGKLNNLSDMRQLNKILSNSSAELFNTFSDNFVFLDDDNNSAVDGSIDAIVTRLGKGPGSLVEESNEKILNLVDDWNKTSETQEKNNIQAKIDKLIGITGMKQPKSGAPITMTYVAGTGSRNLLARESEYIAIQLAKNNFNRRKATLNPDIHNHKLGTHDNYAGLNGHDKFGTLANGAKFMLFDDAGKKINFVGGKCKLKMKLDSGAYTDVEVEGISIVGNKIDFNNLKFTPANIDFNENIELKVGGVYEDIKNSGVNIIYTKKLKVKIKNPDLLNDPADRKLEFDRYNTAGGGTKIETHLQTRNDLDLNKLERQSIARAVNDGDGSKYDRLSDGKKEQFYQQIRQLDHPTISGTKFFEQIDKVGKFNDYNSFRDWFSHDDSDWNKGTNISSKAKYRDFIHNNLEYKSTEYISSQLDDEILKKHDINTFVKAELTKYLDNIEKNKVDSNVHTNIDSDLDNDEHKMKKGPRSLLNNRDKNYMRFFANSSKQIDNQEVKINTSTRPEDLNNPQPVKYKIKLDVSGRNNIQVAIDIEGEQKEIIVKSGDPAALVRRVMRDQRIKNGKVRAHIAYNIYKGMIGMAKDKDISLTYRDDNEHMKQIDVEENGNIVLKTIDGRTDRNTTNKTITDVLFDQKMFENTNDFDESGYNGSLRHGIADISAHFNVAMNNVHTQYRSGVKKRLWGMINSPSRPKLPTSIWLSPIKKLLNFRTNTKFDFSTTVESDGKQINIKFEKNKFTVNMDGLKKEISSRDLGKLLRKRQGRKRVFDGMERDIVEGIYSSMIGQLRTNAKVARSSFGAIDDLTGNMYVLDEDGQFGLITKEQLDSKGNPVHWGMFNKNQYGVLSRKKLRTDGYQILDETQTKELMKNPFLMQRLMKGMNKRMGFWESTRAIFN